MRSVHVEKFGSVEVFTVDADALIRWLNEVTVKIRAEHHEVRDIVLFGSFSKNTFTPASDIDIAIIVSSTQHRFIDRSSIYQGYFSGVDLDTNIFVYTVEELQHMRKSGNVFVEELKSGKRLGTE